MVQPVRPSLSAVVLLPIKSFGEAKHRLSPVLDARERADLARELASRVVRAARDLPVAIVCDDDAVAAWAESVGASVLWRPGVGLNGAVAAGVPGEVDAGTAGAVAIDEDAVDLVLAADQAVDVGVFASERISVDHLLPIVGLREWWTA